MKEDDFNKVINSIEIAEDQSKRIDEFKNMLEKITSINDKKKFLWLDIYKNSAKEREMAYSLFMEAYSSTNLGNEISHSQVGPVLVKYLERASKANDQLIKLATMIEESQEKAKGDEEKNILDQLSNNSRL